jgi:hypothetical protein
MGNAGTPGDGGSANGGTIGASGGAGASSGGGGATNAGSGTGGEAGASSQLYLVDDFADCDAQIIQVDGRSGAWSDISSTPQTFTAGKPPAPSWVDQSCGVFLTGDCSSCSRVGIGVQLSPSTYDLSRFSGIRLTYESESTVFITVEATDGQAHSYATSAAITPGAGESVATVLFSSLMQDPTFVGFTKADAVCFTIADLSTGFGLGIHKLELLP